MKGPRACATLVVVMLILGLALLPSAAMATGGPLDTTFDTDGLVSHQIGINQDFGEADRMGVQSDDKVVVAGHSKMGDDFDISVTRFNPDGSLDTTFDGDGSVVTRVGAGSSFGESVAIQGDGKIVVAGNASNGTNNDFAVVRYNSDGTLDTTFDGDGIVLIPVGSGPDDVRSMAIQADGRILVGGFALIGSTRDFAVVRLNSNGSLDTNFDSDGKVTTAVGGGDDWGESITVQPSDGRIVLAGTVRGTNNDFAVVRYNTNGSLDGTFSGDGKTVDTALGEDDDARSVIIQADGKVVVAGFAANTGGRDFALLRYTTGGALDGTFDGDGRMTTGVGSANDFGESVIQLGDGKLLMAGNVFNGSNNDFGLARFNTNGSLDTTFDGDGKLLTAPGARYDDVRALHLLADGRFYASGHIDVGPQRDRALVRYNAGGTFDTTFSGDGVATAQVGLHHDIAEAGDVIVQPDGAIVTAGYTSNGNNYDVTLLRHTAAGALDTTFSGDGIAVATVGTAGDHVEALARQGDGKLVVTGTTWNGSNFDAFVLRFNADGSLDTTFDGDGRAVFAFGTADDEPRGIVVQPDGKLLVAGIAQLATHDFAVARLNTDGSLDTTFDADGKVTTSIGSGGDVGEAIALQGDGRIVVAGTWDNAGNEDFAVVRYTSAGALDTTFSGDGLATIAVGSAADRVRSVALQSDGSVLVGGHADISGQFDFALVRLTAGGASDTTFDGDGKLTTPIGTGNDVGEMVRLQPDGKLLMTGSSAAPNDFAIARYNPNGALDPTFDGDGKATYSFGSGPDWLRGVGIQPNGRILLAGAANQNGRHRDWAAVRIQASSVPAAPASLAQFRADGTTSIAGGAWTSDGATTNVVLKFNVSDPNTSQTLTPWVEVRPSGTAFSAACGASVAGTTFSGTAVSAPSAGTAYPVTVNVTGLTRGTRYVWRACAVDQAGSAGAWQARGGTPDFGVSSAPATPTLVSPADGSVVTSVTPALTATYSDADTGDNGRVDFQLCSDSTCTTVAQSGSSTTGLASGTNGSWSPPTALVRGTTYYWRAQNVDSTGMVSAWSGIRSFRVDRAPAVPTLVAPADATVTVDSTPDLSATFSDPDSADTGTVSFQVCGNATCTATGDPIRSASSASGIANGSTATITVSTALANGVYYWRAQNQDQHGMQSGWSATRSITIGPTLTIAVDATSVGLTPNTLLPGSNSTASSTVTVTTNNTAGYTLAATDEHDTWGADTSGGAHTITDWTGTGATPTAWASATSGYWGLTVLNATGGRLAKWGIGASATETDFTNNYYAGLDATASGTLHTRSSATTGDSIVMGHRTNVAATQAAGTYGATVALVVTANP